MNNSPGGLPDPAARSLSARMFELVLVLAGFSALTASLTYPLAFRLGTYGYKLYTVGDAQYSVWNVAWVAHALLSNPLHVLDANIFYPHPQTLVYSEANLLAGALAVPVYWATSNAFAAHNFVVLLSFVMSGAATYYLVRYLAHDRRAAAIAGVAFAFCPYAFGHLPHIQLLMTAGIPLSLLAFHRLADRPTLARGAWLGVAMGLQGLGCAYYAVFVALLIGYASLLTAFTGFTKKRTGVFSSYWKALAVGAFVSLAILLPLFFPYLRLRESTGFTRELTESSAFSATWHSYLTSSSYLWQPILARLADHVHIDQLFPGVVALVIGLAGAMLGWKLGGRQRYLATLYGSVAVLAFWESLGPSAGLYRISYELPVFSFLRAPSRFGIIVAISLTTLAGVAIGELLRRTSLASVVAPALLCFAIVDVATPVPMSRIEPINPAYYTLAQEPDGALLEMPPFSRQYNHERTKYMINSTAHWKPIVDAYSDVIPQAFYDNLGVLGGFPSREAFALLEEDRVRYVTFDLREYDKQPALHNELVAKLREFQPYLRQIYADSRIWLYEIVSYPSGGNLNLKPKT